MGKKKVRMGAECCKDRISRLPGELIHKILSFLDAKIAVQTSLLSKRWRFIWPTLPFLNFGEYKDSSPHSTYMFIRHVLSNRYHRASVSELNMFVSDYECVFDKELDGCLVEKFVEYAIAHNVKCIKYKLTTGLDLLYEHTPYKLSTLNSNSLTKLQLTVLADLDEYSDIWNLPVLTTLHLMGDIDEYYTLSDSWLTCLPALTTLTLDGWDLSYSFSFSLPNLSSLCLFHCGVPEKVWNFPALLTLELNDCLPKNVGHVFSTLVCLQNLTIVLGPEAQKDHLLSFPQLVNLNLTTWRGFVVPCLNIVVLAPKLRTFTSDGIFSITFGIPELENVYIKLQGWFQNMSCERKETYYLRFAHMLLGLGKAKNISFDLDSIEALSGISNYLASFPSPFCNLKCVKLPQGYKESSISGALRSYLLGGSPRATIVTTLSEALSAISDFLASFPSPFYNLKRVKLPRGYKASSMSSALRSYLLGGSPRATVVTTLSQDNMIRQTAAVSMTAQNEVIQEPLATATKELVDCQYINKSLCSHNVEMVVQEHHVVGNPLVDANRVRQINSLVEGRSNDRGSSPRKSKDFRIWRGHEVNSEFVCLLDTIMLKHPETFEHFSTKSKKLCTMNLNMLCTSLNDFTKISMTEVDSEMIAGYKDVYAYLQNQGLDASWAVNRLNYIEQLRFSKPLIPELHAIDCCINDAKSKVQDLQARVDDAKTQLQDAQTLRMQKMTEIEKAFGTMGTKLAVGFIGDDILSGPDCLNF